MSRIISAEKHRLHNRFLHGYGVVTGLEVSISDDPPGMVRVEPGYAIDRMGNDILLPEAQVVAFPERGKKSLPDHRMGRAGYRFRAGAQQRGGGGADGSHAGGRVRSAEAGYGAHGEEELCEDEGIVLARLKKRGGVWRVDKRFIAQRVVVCK